MIQYVIKQMYNRIWKFDNYGTNILQDDMDFQPLLSNRLVNKLLQGWQMPNTSQYQSSTIKRKIQLKIFLLFSIKHKQHLDIHLIYHYYFKLNQYNLNIDTANSQMQEESFMTTNNLLDKVLQDIQAKTLSTNLNISQSTLQKIAALLNISSNDANQVVEKLYQKYINANQNNKNQTNLRINFNPDDSCKQQDQVQDQSRISKSKVNFQKLFKREKTRCANLQLQIRRQKQKLRQSEQSNMSLKRQLSENKPMLDSFQSMEKSLSGLQVTNQQKQKKMLSLKQQNANLKQKIKSIQDMKLQSQLKSLKENLQQIKNQQNKNEMEFLKVKDYVLEKSKLLSVLISELNHRLGNNLKVNPETFKIFKSQQQNEKDQGEVNNLDNKNINQVSDNHNNDSIDQIKIQSSENVPVSNNAAQMVMEKRAPQNDSTIQLFQQIFDQVSKKELQKLQPQQIKLQHHFQELRKQLTRVNKHIKDVIEFFIQYISKIVSPYLEKEQILEHLKKIEANPGSSILFENTKNDLRRIKLALKDTKKQSIICREYQIKKL